MPSALSGGTDVAFLAPFFAALYFGPYTSVFLSSNASQLLLRLSNASFYAAVQPGTSAVRTAQLTMDCALDDDGDIRVVYYNVTPLSNSPPHDATSQQYNVVVGLQDAGSPSTVSFLPVIDFLPVNDTISATLSQQQLLSSLRSRRRRRPPPGLLVPILLGCVIFARLLRRVVLLHRCRVVLARLILSGVLVVLVLYADLGVVVTV